MCFFYPFDSTVVQWLLVELQMWCLTTVHYKKASC